MSEHYAERTETLRGALERTMDAIRGSDVSLRDLLRHIGDHGSLILCAILTVPFLLPVSIPGVSTVFGLAIILLGIGLALNRTPWLPDRIMDRPIDGEKLRGVLKRGLGLVDRLEKVVRKRMGALTRDATMNRVNALAIVAGGVLLMFPLGLVPFSNTLPAFAILLFCIGMSQRDGLLVIGGYAMLVATVVYFSVLAYLAVAAGRGLASFFSG